MDDQRILIVDDEPVIVRQCGEILAAEGYQVQGAYGGQPALMLLEKGPFDLLLVDLRMPLVDGLAVIRGARKRDPEAVAVAMTSYGTMENAVEALRAGARDFLLKPFEPDELLMVVEKTLAARRLEQENLLLRAQVPILEISQALMTQGDVQFLASRLLEVIVQQIGARQGKLMLLDEETEQLAVAGVVGLPIETVAKRLPAGERIVAQILQGQEPAILNESSWAILNSGPGTNLESSGNSAQQAIHAVCVPLHTAKRTMGLITLNRLPSAPQFSSAELNLLAIMASQTAIALENAHLYETVARMFDQVRRSHEQLRFLAQRVVTAQEEERRRLSRELHDEAGQALTALKLSLELILDDLPEEAGSLHRRVGEAVDLADETMEQIRLLAQDLRPPALDAVGLDLALEGYCHDFSARTGLPVTYSGTGLPELPNTIRTNLYRLLQEALTNVARHANASQAMVSLHYDEQTISLTVVDDGQGFDASASLNSAEPPTGIGILGMQERLELLSGSLAIQAEPDQGTRLVACIPWRVGP